MKSSKHFLDFSQSGFCKCMYFLLNDGLMDTVFLLGSCMTFCVHHKSKGQTKINKNIMYVRRLVPPQTHSGDDKKVKF